MVHDIKRLARYNKFLKDENRTLKGILKYLYDHHRYEIDILMEEFGIEDIEECLKY